MDQILSTYNNDLKNTDEFDESKYEEEDEPEEEEFSKFHIMSLRAAVKDVSRFISSIEVEYCSMVSSTVSMTNELTREIVQRCQNYKQNKLTDFSHQI